MSLTKNTLKHSELQARLPVKNFLVSRRVKSELLVTVTISTLLTYTGCSAIFSQELGYSTERTTQLV
ncbi:MAG: hypothetical protein J07HQX50_00820 [Haloquadratum sp. J07HQX50]|nr:MAG: hypothetical protein J07HQX50_00820 [Haloquadratum sp. J07HQX50]